MIVHDVLQGTPAWLKLRLGIPTASSFHKIITPVTGAPSKQAEAYRYELLAELAAGRPLEALTDKYNLPWLVRGNALEDQAVRFYAFQKDIEPVKVGFCTTDDGRIGASPDRMVGDRGLAEFKCPAPQTQIKYLLYGKLEDAYRPQLQGQLYVTERDWNDICAFSEDLESVIIRVERDDEYIAKLAGLLNEFCDKLSEERAVMEARGYIHEIEEPEPHGDFDVTDEDVSRIYAQSE